MTLTSKGPILNDAERRSVAIGYQIHQAVIAEGRKQSAELGYRVCAYLDHDLIGSGKLPFVKWDEKTQEVSRKFSKELAASIRDHVEDLKTYFEYVRVCDKV